jgi:hypothetical protein
MSIKEQAIMTEMTISGVEGLEAILERLSGMPMTRRYGKGLVARIPGVDTDNPAALYMRVSGPKQAIKGKGSLPEQFRSTWEEIERRGGHVVAIYVDVCTASNRNRWAFSVLLEDVKAGKLALVGCWHSFRWHHTFWRWNLGGFLSGNHQRQRQQNQENN